MANNTNVYMWQLFVLIAWAESKVFCCPTAKGGSGGFFLGIPEPSQPWEVEEQCCPPAWLNMCSSYSSSMKQLFFVMSWHLWACNPGTITSHFCETPWGQVLPVCLTWSSNKCEAVTHLLPHLQMLWALRNPLSTPYLHSAQQKAVRKSRRYNKNIEASSGRWLPACCNIRAQFVWDWCWL